MKNSKVRRRTSPSNESDRLSEIYQVAAQIICEKGYDATSMDDIADAVGITKAGIYHYIHGKGEMLFQIMSYGMDRLDRHVIIPAREIRDPEARLRAIIRSHALLIAAGSNNKGNNPITIVTDEVAGLAPAHRRAIEKRNSFTLFAATVQTWLRELVWFGRLKNFGVSPEFPSSGWYSQKE